MHEIRVSLVRRDETDQLGSSSVSRNGNQEGCLEEIVVSSDSPPVKTKGNLDAVFRELEYLDRAALQRNGKFSDAAQIQEMANHIQSDFSPVNLATTAGREVHAPRPREEIAAAISEIRRARLRDALTLFGNRFFIGVCFLTPVVMIILAGVLGPLAKRRMALASIP